MSNVRRSAYLLTFLIAAALVSAMAWRPAPPARYVGLTRVDIPSQAAGFTLKGDYEMTADVKAALAAADIVSRTYDDGARALDFVMIGGTDRSALHDPRGCLVIGSGGKLENDHAEQLPGTNVIARSCRLVDTKNGVDFDVLYLYAVDGQVINQVTQIRMGMLWSAVIGKKNKPVHFLRFMMPLETTSEAAATNHTRLRQFASQMWKSLEPKIVSPDHKP